MGLIAPGTKSVKAEPRLSQLPRPRPVESMHGPDNVDGRKLRLFLDRTLPINPITNARETLMICLVGPNTNWVNFFDLCAISLPLPREGGLPVGLMLVARNGHDHRLFRIAAAVEQLFAA